MYCCHQYCGKVHTYTSQMEYTIVFLVCRLGRVLMLVLMGPLKKKTNRWKNITVFGQECLFREQPIVTFWGEMVDPLKRFLDHLFVTKPKFVL